MGNILPEFQKFLASHKLVPEEKIRFHVYWVRKFSNFSNGNEHLNLSLLILMNGVNIDEVYPVRDLPAGRQEAHR